MVNLLPIKNKKIIKKERTKRFVIFLGFGFAMLLMSQLIFSSVLFFSVNSTKANLNKEKTEIENLIEIKNYINLETEVNHLNNLIKNFQKDTGQAKAISPSFLKILDNMPFSLKINSLNFENNKLKINGYAPTRDGLLNFIENLKKENSFTNITSPLSNYLSEKDVDFSLSIELR